MKINIAEIVNHDDFKCSKTQKTLRDTFVRVIETIYGFRPSENKEINSVINLLAMKISRKKYSLTQLRKMEKNWLESKVIEINIEGGDGQEMAEEMQEKRLDCETTKKVWFKCNVSFLSKCEFRNLVVFYILMFIFRCDNLKYHH